MPRSPETYNRFREQQAEISAERSRKGRDIGPLPAVVDPARRAQAERDLEFFCRKYFPGTYSLAWSADHRKVIDKIQSAVTEGGLFANAMPRGSGKTSLAVTGALWALITGKREFVALIGADEASAASLLESIKAEVESNDLLLEDWPEVCHPVRRLEGIANRCKGQTLDGERTQIGWTAKEIVLPSVKGSNASGGVVRVAGITGRIRGMQFTRPDGKKVRPSLAIVDDPQTDESARSPSQNAQREQVVTHTVLGLVGPGQKIAAVMPCTVIAPGDMADRMLDRQKHPEWQGERCRLLNALPKNLDLWDEYARVRANGLRAGDGGRAGTAFYKANREALDEGAEAAWPARHNPDEESAVQHAMNLRADNPKAFAAEYQNEPVEEQSDDEVLSADEIAAKVNGVPAGKVPVGREKLTAMIDVQGKLLYYAVVAWSDDMTGDVIEYGSYPDQKRAHFAARDARATLAMKAKGAGEDGAILAGLNALVENLARRKFARMDGADMNVARILVDSNWKTDLVYQFHQQSPHAGMVWPSQGRGVGAASKPWDQYAQRPGEYLGHHWMIPSVKGKRAARHVAIDTNYWKTLLHERLAVKLGDPGGLALFGKRGTDHQLFAEHLTAEYRVRTTGQGRTVDEWRQKPGKPDNHWLDCVVGAAVGASMLGCNPLKLAVRPVAAGKGAAAAKSAGPTAPAAPARPAARRVIKSKPLE